ncbi:MAG: V-type ATPase subunit, partial [Anaerolineae bacterium]
MSSAFSAVRTAGANARVRGLYARRLTERQWDELLRSEDYDRALTALAATSYGRVLEPLLGESNLTLRRVERELWAASADNCWHASALLLGQARDLLRVWWQHWELENLKTVFRGVHHGIDHEAVR